MVLFIKVFKNGVDENGVNVRMTEELFLADPDFGGAGGAGKRVFVCVIVRAC